MHGQQAEIQQLEAQSQMDGDTVRQSESVLRKENAALKAQLAALPSAKLRRRGLEAGLELSGDEPFFSGQHFSSS
eukprot:COSAG04_NODE_184_length_21108_cov_56.740492_14_plen_75_part_00